MMNSTVIQGCSWPLQENEKKVLRAAAKAQRISGAPLLIHPARHQDSPLVYDISKPFC